MNWNDIPQAPAPHRLGGQMRLSPDIWEDIKERYLRGESAGQLAELYGIGISTLRVRARQEGWRRLDEPDPQIDARPTLEELARDSRPNFAVMADTAMRRAARAVAEGQLTEAQGWTRVGRSLAAAARRERARESSD